MNQNNQIEQQNKKIDNQYKWAFGIVILLPVFSFVFNNYLPKLTTPLIVTLVIIFIAGIYGFLRKDKQALFIIKYCLFSLIPMGFSYIFLSSVKKLDNSYCPEDMLEYYILIMLVVGILTLVITTCIYKDKFFKKENFCILFISFIISALVDFISFYYLDHWLCESILAIAGILLTALISHSIDTSNC